MLQQILNDMYVDPELLAELDEEQKQILFCKMREEQVRKWKILNEEESEEEKNAVRKTKEGGKKVSFLMGGDGEPLVVVLGGDEDVDAILQERAKRQAEMEGEALRKAAEEELDKLVRLSQSTVKAMERNSQRTPTQSSKISDPTRDAVVRSLQEATKEMEEEIRALELQEKEGFSETGLDSPPSAPLSPQISPPPQFSPPSSSPSSPPASAPSPSFSSHSPIFPSPSPTPTYESMKPLKDSINSSRKSSSSTSYSGSLSEERREEPQKLQYHSRPQISVAPYAADRPPVTPFGVAAQIEQFERLSESSLEALKTATLERAKNRRQKEILDNLRHQVEAAKKNQSPGTPIIVAAEREEVAWREQERKAKEAERRIREIARRAREEHRRTSSSSAPDMNGSESEFIGKVKSPSDPFMNGDINGDFNGDINGNIKNSQEDFSNNNGNLNAENERSNTRNQSPRTRRRVRPFRPPSKEAVIEWFKEEELPKGVGLNRRKTAVESWFHGIISRTEAERILDRADNGSFLVRVSERIWGYAVSYKAPDRFRHYLIDAIGGRYAFLGSHQSTHLSLGNLIEYHKKEFITSSGREVLDKPCGQVDPKRPDYLDLFLGTSYLNLIS